MGYNDERSKLKKFIKDEIYLQGALESLNIGGKAFVKYLCGIRKEQKQDMEQLRTEIKQINEQINDLYAEMIKEPENISKNKILQLKLDKLIDDRKIAQDELEKVKGKLAKIDIGSLISILAVTGLSAGVAIMLHKKYSKVESSEYFIDEEDDSLAYLDEIALDLDSEI